ncbi:MAG: hypothetical protein EDM82_00155 [Cyanobacteria bacterium CYA]|nr:MAG: hypothetical protein EDM82_00155 [Cyanobacteria bacterium CYA]
MTQPPSPRQAAEYVVHRLAGEGHVAYFAGGCVRDELLGRPPTDYDVATDAPPDRIRRLFRRTSEVGVAFGVVLVRDLGPAIEVATFRADGPYTDRRRPDSVTFSDARSDAARRDFTINALFLDPLAPGDGQIRGQVIDLVGGLDDLHAGLVRAVGDPEHRLAEDHLRALRGVRFAARLGFEIEEGTFRAMRAHASELVGVSRERIGEEMRRILAHVSRVRALRLLAHAGLDSPVFNEPASSAPTPVLERQQPSASFAQCLAALAIDRHGLEEADDRLARRWRTALILSNEEHNELAGVLRLTRVIRREWPGAGVAQRKRWAVDGHFEGFLSLFSHQDDFVARVRSDVDRLRHSAGGLAPVPFVSGEDLIAAGFCPGRGFGELLNRVYDAQLEGEIGNQEEGIERAGELARAFGVQRSGRRS